jgi:hypothetical protein
VFERLLNRAEGATRSEFQRARKLSIAGRSSGPNCRTRISPHSLATARHRRPRRLHQYVGPERRFRWHDVAVYELAIGGSSSTVAVEKHPLIAPAAIASSTIKAVGGCVGHGGSSFRRSSRPSSDQVRQKDTA